LAVLLVVSAISYAYQPDAPYLAFEKRHKTEWAKQDTLINEKLAALEQRFGKKPNIIYILTDDIGWGELGWQGGGKHRGTPTPVLDTMAKEGMRFWSAYAEPSCTPTRIAINTGRHPVRTGLLSVLWPGQTEGLSPKEVTIAELLSDAGYHTAMWGKWHLGDEPEHCPTNQGYDYAHYGLFNGAPDAWQDSRDMYDTPSPVEKRLSMIFPDMKNMPRGQGLICRSPDMSLTKAKAANLSRALRANWDLVVRKRSRTSPTNRCASGLRRNPNPTNPSLSIGPAMRFRLPVPKNIRRTPVLIR
jgi:hypothetical protein